RDDHTLRLGRERAVELADLLPRPDARPADRLQSAGHDHGFVTLRELASVVDRDPSQDEVPRVGCRPQGLLHPRVAAPLQVGEVDGVVDVAVGVHVPPADGNTLFVHDRVPSQPESSIRSTCTPRSTSQAMALAIRSSSPSTSRITHPKRSSMFALRMLVTRSKFFPRWWMTGSLIRCSGNVRWSLTLLMCRSPGSCCPIGSPRGRA